MKNLKTIAFIMLCLFGFTAHTQATEKQQLAEKYKQVQKIFADNMAILNSTNFEEEDYSCKQYQAVSHISLKIPNTINPVAPISQFPHVFQKFVLRLQENNLINQFKADELNSLYSAVSDRRKLQRALCAGDLSQFKQHHKDAFSLDVHSFVYRFSEDTLKKFSQDPDLMQKRTAWLTRHMKRKRFYYSAMRNKDTICTKRIGKLIKAIYSPKPPTDIFTEEDLFYLDFLGNAYGQLVNFRKFRCEDSRSIPGTPIDLIRTFKVYSNHAPLSYEAKVVEADTYER